MTHLTLAALVLAAATSVAPEKAAAPAAAAAATPAAPAPKAQAAEPKAPAKASREAIQDAIGALLGPCSPEMATAKVTAVSVIDAKALNALIEKEKLNLPKAQKYQLFLAVDFDNAGTAGKDWRQITTGFQLTTEQAQVLVGEKFCVILRLEQPKAAKPAKK